MRRAIYLLLGSLLLLVPSLLEYTQRQREENQIESFVNDLEALTAIADEENEWIHENQEDIVDVFNDNIGQVPFEDVFQTPNYESILVIESIDFIQPVLAGANEENLNVSVSSLDNGKKPWTKGNYQIAGHRSLTFGLHFNRLDELEIGDELVIYDSSYTKYTYEVYDKLVVYKKDFESLYEKYKNELTLITCHPYGETNPDKRLIIKSILVNN